jgi:hypothetical protein
MKQLEHELISLDYKGWQNRHDLQQALMPSAPPEHIPQMLGHWWLSFRTPLPHRTYIEPDDTQGEDWNQPKFLELHYDIEGQPLRQVITCDFPEPYFGEMIGISALCLNVNRPVCAHPGCYFWQKLTNLRNAGLISYFGYRFAWDGFAL